jgi:hypothetical protein
VTPATQQLLDLLSDYRSTLDQIKDAIAAEGVDVNATNKDGERPLSMAYDADVQMALLEAGADPLMPNPVTGEYALGDFKEAFELYTRLREKYPPPSPAPVVYEYPRLVISFFAGAWFSSSVATPHTVPNTRFTPLTP